MGGDALNTEMEQHPSANLELEFAKADEYARMLSFCTNT
jgi:hypothetical protein